MTAPADPRAARLAAIGETEALQLRLATVATPEALDRVAQARAEAMVAKLLDVPIVSWAELTAVLRALFLALMQLELASRTEARADADALLMRMLRVTVN